MAITVVRHKVADYDAWKKVFDGFLEKRKAAGEQSFELMKTENENEIVGVFKFDSVENAKKFFDSDEIKAAMKEAGVTDEPSIYIGEKIE